MMLSHFQNGLNKPYYFFRPSQVILRLKRKLFGQKVASAYEQVQLPWGLFIRIRPLDTIGAAIFRMGVYDLCVSEVLWRLLDQGETAVDAGANIGHMTSLMAKRVAGAGKVLSFEPHPQVFQELSFNAALWANDPSTGQIKLHEMGLSKDNGVANLYTTSEFGSNRGTASLEGDDKEHNKIAYSVAIKRLDDVLGSIISAGVMKIDVEGHELELLRGASCLLTEHRLRDIIFEDHGVYPSPVTEYLEGFGYTILSVEQGPFAVRVSPAQGAKARYAYEAKSYLATLNKQRALDRLSKPGYQLMWLNGNNWKIGVLFRIAVGLILSLAIWSLVKSRRHK